MKKFWLYIIFMTGIISSLQAQNPPNTHLVKQGETLYRIHVMYKVPVDALKKSNPTIQGNTIKTGDVLVIPTQEGTEKTAMVKSKPAPKPTIKKSVEVQMDAPIVMGDKVDLSKIKPNQPAKAKPKTVNPLSGPQEVSDKVAEIINPTTTSKNMVNQEIINKLSVNLNQYQPILHEVNKGETLFSISQRYKESLMSLQNWNNFNKEEYTIKPTQVLVVGWKTTALTTPSQISNLIPESKPVSRPIKVNPRRPGNYETTWWKEELDSTGMYKSVKQTGIAVRYDDSDDSNIGDNLFVLHKTAPIRSVVKITNPINKKSVYVLVSARLPKTVEHQNVLMKLTLSVAKKINLLDDNSSVVSHYHTQDQRNVGK